MPVSADQGHDPVITILHSDDRPKQLDGPNVRFVTDETLTAALPGTEVLLVWDFTSTAVRDAWPAADSLRWVHTASAGVDRLTFPALLDSDVVLTNSRGVFDVPMAEYVTGLVIAMAKDLAGTLEAQSRREWRHRESERVGGRTAVVVGSGPIGRATATMLSAVGMTVELVGRRAGEGVHAIDALPGLLPRAEWLVLAAPLTDSTRGMLDAAAIRLLPPRARVVNVGRGALIVQDDLVAALREGHLAGAALDVFEREPLPADSPLWDLPGVIVSPHMSGDILGWRDELEALFVANLDRFRAGEPLENVVDKTLGFVTTAGGPS